ncbi:MAG: hypothetical protein VYD64_00070 [Pseudomonadota bacterium]|nr:hypothetical protein [Pseudomonadota bacterium]
MKPKLPLPPAAAALLLLVWLPLACQGGASQALSLKSDDEPLQVMLSVGRTAQDCWFASKDPAFGGFRLADETNSHSGRPRLLLVPRRDPGGLPKLVIQAERIDGMTDIQVYGPALATSLGTRITGDVKRWSAGDKACR